MTIQALFRVLLRWWWFLLLGAALGLAAGYLLLIRSGTVSSSSLETYSATATVSIGTEVQGLDQSNQDLGLAESLVSTYLELAKRPPITQRVVRSLDLPFSASTLGNTFLEISQPEKTQLIEITGKHADPETAAAIANSTAQELQASAPTRPTRLIQLVSAAEVPQNPSTEPYLLLGIATLAGLFLSIGPVLIVEFALDRPYTPEWAANRINLPILGIAKRKDAPGRPSWLGLHHRAICVPSEPVWWTVMTTLERATDDPDEFEAQGKSIVVTAPKSKGNKTAAAVTLAHAAAGSGKQTILVDADVRHAGFRSWFSLGDRDGVANLAVDGYDSEELKKLLVPGAIDGLVILPAGPKPAELEKLVKTKFWHMLLHDLSQQADLVVVNVPALNAAPEATVLSTIADGVLITMDLGKTRAPQINEIQDVLDKSGATVLGAVLYQK